MRWADGQWGSNCMVKPEHREDCQCPGAYAVLISELLSGDGPHPDPYGDLPEPEVIEPPELRVARAVQQHLRNDDRPPV